MKCVQLLTEFSDEDIVIDESSYDLFYEFRTEIIDNYIGVLGRQPYLDELFAIAVACNDYPVLNTRIDRMIRVIQWSL